MRVISQDGTIDVPYEISSFSMAVGKYEDVEHAAIYCHNSSTAVGTKIAEYSQKEKAKKAMEVLRNKYMEYTSANYSKVFQFPTEEELEEPMEVISVLESVQKGMEDNIYNFCKDGKCSQCGNCCSNLLPMSRKEVDAIHRYIRKNHIKECKHLLPTANRPYDMTCPFLDTDKSCEKCRIYPVRPEICKQFICDNEQRAKHNRALLRQTRQIVDVREEFFG